jgi:predicted transporter
MNKWVEIFIGLIFVIGAILAWTYLPGNWGQAALQFLKGGVIWIVILIGLLFLMLGISDLKE